MKILGESKVKGTFGKEWNLPQPPVVNPNKPGKVSRVFNAATKYKVVCLKDMLLAGTDLLRGLIGTMFRFREEIGNKNTYIKYIKYINTGTLFLLL